MKMKMMRFFWFSFFAAFIVFQSHAETKDLSGPPRILYFIGRIEIVYPDSPSMIIKTGEKPPVLESGTLLRVLEGKLALEITNGKGQVTVKEYHVGQVIRITDAKGNWVAATTDPDTFHGSQSNLSSPGQEQTESEIIQEGEASTISPSPSSQEEEEEEDGTPVSPS